VQNPIRRRLLVLGAGPFQIPGIRKAAATGCEVITLDFNPSHLGHRFSHRAINCSTTDITSVVQIARELSVDAVCTFSSDIAVPSVAAVAEALSLPGPSRHAAETMSEKHKFRCFMRDAGLPHPNFVYGDDPEFLLSQARDLRYPVVCKPVDTSGSRGVSLIPSYDPHTLGEAIRFAGSYSRTHRICIEEFVPGIEVGGDAFLLNGCVAFSLITHKHLRGFVVTGHSIPTNIKPFEESRVIARLEETCNKLGYRDGPLNFDVIVNAENQTILEMSPRTGGNGIPLLIERASGIDLEQCTIETALGRPLSAFPYQSTRRGCGSVIFGSSTTGILEKVINTDTVMLEIPEVFALSIYKQPGERVEAFTHNGNILGYALFDSSNAAEYSRIANAVLHLVNARTQFSHVSH